jgi:hypothetical protein
MKVNFTALIPEREANIKSMVENVISLPTLAEGVATIKELTESEKHADLPIEFRNLTMDESNGGMKALGLDFQYTKHALTHAVARIKPPEVVGMAGYLAACPPDLRATNFNFWHDFFYGPDAENVVKNDILLRTRIGDENIPLIRAIVSQSYSPIDDAPLLEQFAKVVPDGAHVRLARGDLRSRFDVIWPTMKKTIMYGDPLLVSVRLVNSETGASSIRLEPVVYSTQRNLSVIIPTNREMAIRHIGEAGRRLGREFTNAMNTIDPFIEMLNESYSDFVGDNFESYKQMLDALKKAFQLNDIAIRGIDTLLSGSNGARAHVVDALASVANELPIDEGEKLQKAAGVLVTKGWKFVKRFIEEE